MTVNSFPIQLSLMGENTDTPLIEKEETTKPVKDEHYRLAGKGPLATLITLSVGPMVSQVVGALYSIIDTIWVSLACGDHGMAAVSTYNCFDNMGRSFGFFLCTAASSKASQLYGQKKDSEVNQIFCDLIRMVIVCSLIVPAILIPVVRPCARWFGASEELVEYGFSYIQPLLWGSVSTCLFLCCGGFLQGEGRTYVFAAMEIFSFILNMGVFDPLFLLGCKLEVMGAALSTLLSELIPGIILLILFFCGKFTAKPKLSGLFKKFSPHTWPALKVGISQLIANISFYLPTIVVRKLLGMSVTPEEYDSAFAGYNVTIRFSYLTNAIFIAINQGFLPAASYANGAKNPSRWLALAGHAVWINFLWGSFTAALTWTIPRQLSMMFSRSEDYLKWAGPMMRTRNALGFLAFGRFNCQAILQSLQKGGLAMCLSVCSQLCAILGFSLLMFYTNKHDAIRLQWCYPMTDSFGCVLGFTFVIWPVIKQFKAAKAAKLMNTESMSTMTQQYT